MKINEYQELALRTANTDAMKIKEEAMLNGVLGLNGEAGEVADIVKKYRYQGHKLDKERLIKELGDVCWYVALLAYSLDCDLETVLQKNIDKLKKRYPEGFEKERSLHRESEDK